MKNIPEHIINELIPLILSGEATAEEQQQLEAWLAASNENREYIEQMQETWNLADNMPLPNAEASWNKLQPKLAKGGNQNGLRWYAMAAMLTLLLGASYVFMYKMPFAEAQYFTLKAETQDTLLLADGSVVYLNAQAEISYPEAFKGNTRSIILNSGEAFFEIEKNQNKPFIIQAGNTEIKVLGTSFNTKVTGDSVEVIVNTGKVSVTVNDEAVILTVGMKAVYETENQKLKSATNNDANYLAWKNKVLEFENAPVTEVLSKVAALYGIVVMYDAQQLSEKRLTGRFKMNSLEQLMEVIALSADLKVSKQNEQYIISATEL